MKPPLRAGDSAVLDLVPLPDHAGVLSSTAAGGLTVWTPAGKARRRLRKESSGLWATRIIAATRSRVCLWGWEQGEALDLATGASVWELELGHSHDEAFGRTAVWQNLGCLPGGLVIDLDTGESVVHDEFWKMVDSATFVAAHARGFVYSTHRELMLWQPGVPLVELARFDQLIEAIACAGETVAVLLVDGSIRMGPRELASPWAKPTYAELAIIPGGLALAVTTEEEPTGSIAVSIDGEWTFKRSGPGAGCLGFDGAAPCVTGALVSTSPLRDYALPGGLQPTASCRLGDTLFVGFGNGQVFMLTPEDASAADG